MKHKTFLPLMEQMCMILFFAIAAAICLQGFAKANQISYAQREKDQAVIAVQNAAQVLKQTGGDLDDAAKILGGRYDGTAVTVPCAPREGAVAFYLKITPCSDENPLLGSAEVQALRDEEVIFAVTVCWQEVR